MRLSLAVLALSAALPLAAPAAAQIHQYGNLAINPAGDRIATTEAAQRGHAAITLRDARTGAVQRRIDPCAKCGYAGLTFGPTGQLAFVAREPGAPSAQLMVVDEAGTLRTVATIPGLASTPRYSPDGTRIALLVTLGAAKETGATQAGVRQVGEIGETNDEQRLAVFRAYGPPIAAADVQALSPADRFIYEYDWTPDARGFAVTSALGNGDNNWWIATLDYVDAQTGAVRPIAKPATQLNYPRVSPDGRSVAYIGGLMSDNGSVGGDIWTVPLAGGTPTDVTAHAPLTFTSLAWTQGGLRGVALAGDKMQLVAIAPGKPLTTGYSQSVSLSAAFAADGTHVAIVAQDWTHAPALLAGQNLSPVPITHDNDGVRPAISARSISWKSDQFTAQGWLLGPLTPPAGPSGKGAPMIVNVHGGPSAASTPRFVEHGPGTEYEDAGYYVFLPNPRGSYGQGEAFTAANKRDFGGGDLRDILSGVDAAERAAPIDDARLGLTGCSYGGFMAMWANTQTNRFKAIVAGAGLSNWISYYGTNGIDQWMLPFYGKSAYDDHKAYEDMSAVYHAKTARTPTFIYVGERDIEVPPTQSIEWWHALRNQGVDTSLVIYPDAGHCVSRPDQQADVRKRALAWFGKYLEK